MSRENHFFDIDFHILCYTIDKVKDRSPVRKKVHTMRASTKNILYGKYHEVRGSFRSTIGNTVNSRRMAYFGHAERLGGIVQWRFGRVERVFGW
jgi:hypothetical protein